MPPLPQSVAFLKMGGSYELPVHFPALTPALGWRRGGSVARLAAPPQPLVSILSVEAPTGGADIKETPYTSRLPDCLGQKAPFIPGGRGVAACLLWDLLHLRDSVPRDTGVSDKALWSAAPLLRVCAHACL